MPEVEALGLGVLKLRPTVHRDERGAFAETWSRDAWARAGVDVAWVQDNHVQSRERGTLRGLHLQVPPHAQAKLVRVSRGRVWDVAVDVRPGSPTRARWVATELSAEGWEQLYIPAGLAHGYVTLEPDSEVQYKVSAAYHPDSERAVRPNDPDLAIDWPIAPDARRLSRRDSDAPMLAEAALGTWT